ncbi:ECF transporter S component [Petroclostridium sp. X23]|uniref:ECF transporter S component n=1 Tax=Petroclostridium sp. X23 TaxID=3045146 RepID=UPI0024AE4578|nr:ECF transporter S component [Petroclostridium sp. X23]WHH61529.1 ECF transporter S component [Petroclostridium sp. X23]
MMKTQTVKQVKVHSLVKIALLAAIASIVMYAEFMIPMMPVFLKMDLSEIPILIGTFALGPAAGVVIELIKNLVHMPSTSTSFIGEIANFFVGIAFIIPAGYIYRAKKNRNGAILGLVAGTICMTTFASILNYFVLIPLYQTVLGLPMDAIIGMGTKANAAIVDLKTLIVFAFIPFNLLKSIIISTVTLFIYKKLSPILHK